MRSWLVIGGVALTALVALIVWEVRSSSRAVEDEASDEVERPRDGVGNPMNPDRWNGSARRRPPPRRPVAEPVEPAPDPTGTAGTAPTPGAHPAGPAPSLEVVDASPVDIRRRRVKDLKALYRTKDYETALDEAFAVLKEYPGEIEAYMVIVLASCAMGEGEQAQQYYDLVDGDASRRRLVRGCRDVGMILQ